MEMKVEEIMEMEKDEALKLLELEKAKLENRNLELANENRVLKKDLERYKERVKEDNTKLEIALNILKDLSIY